MPSLAHGKYPRPTGCGLPLDEERQTRFLDSVAKHGRTIDAAFEISINLSTIDKHKKSNPAFAQALADARLRWVAKIEAEIKHRAMDGEIEHIRYKGEIVGTKRIKSDQLLLALARKYDPAFRERQTVETVHSGGFAVGLEDLGTLPKEDRDALEEILSRLSHLRQAYTSNKCTH